MKAIFVDNGSLKFMCRGLGFRRVDYKALFQILTSEVGKEDAYLKGPLITIEEDAKPPFIRALRKIGFEVALYTPKTGQDDEIIIDRISKLDPNLAVTEIILVSADFDYVEILSAMVAREMSVYLVATRAKDAGDGRAMLGQRYDHFLGKVFHFVDLAQYKDRLIFRGPRINGPPSGGENEKEHK